MKRRLMSYTEMDYYIISPQIKFKLTLKKYIQSNLNVPYNIPKLREEIPSWETNIQNEDLNEFFSRK